jgi:hypothetical protein
MASQLRVCDRVSQDLLLTSLFGRFLRDTYHNALVASNSTPDGKCTFFLS